MTPPEMSEARSDSGTERKITRRTALKLWASRSITPLGWFVVTSTLVSLLLATWMGLVEYAVAGIFGLILLLVAIPYLIGRSHGAIRLSLERDRVTVGAGAVIQVTVRNGSLRPMLPSRIEVSVDEKIVSLDVPVITSQATAEVSAPLETPVRGIIRVGPATTVRQDPLGMFRRARTDDTIITLFVHPQTVTVPSSSVGLIRDLDGNPTANIVDSDIAFHAVRPYVAGDAQRHIHWKSTAKTGALMVKQFEETRRSRLAILLATHESEFASADEFELAVSVAASLGQQSIIDGRETEVLTGASKTDSGDNRKQRVRSLTTVTPRALLDALTRLGQRDGVTTLDHLGGWAAQTRQNASLVVVVTGSVVNYQQLRRATDPFGSDVRIVAINCDPAGKPGIKTVGDITVLTVGLLPDLQQLLLRGAVS